MESNEKSFFESGTPKLLFYFGLTLGAAAVLLVNNLYISTSGTFKMPRAEAAIVKNVGGNANNPAPGANDPVGQQPSATPVKGIQADDHVRGNKNAKVVMIEYSDFECSYCQRFHPTMQKIVDAYPNQVAWVFRHFPLSFHQHAEAAANASECASEQGKFWEYSDKLYENQKSLGDSLYEKLAGDLKLNVSKFKSCMSAKKYASRVSRDLDEGSSFGVDGTPGTFINGQLVPGALPYESIKQMVDAALQ